MEMYESEKARLERIMCEFTADDPQTPTDGEGIPRAIRVGIGQEELLLEGGRGIGRSVDLQEEFLRNTRQMIRDVMAERGETLVGLSRRVRTAREIMASKHHVDMRLSSLWKIANEMGMDVRIQLIPREDI